MKPCLLTSCVTAVLLAVLMCATPSRSLAYDLPEWRDVSASDWSIVKDTARQISDACMVFEYVVFDEKDIQDDDVNTVLYRRIRILSEEGRDWADVTLPILSADQKVKKIRARVVLRDGTVIEMPKDKIHEKEIVKGKDVKVKEISFSLPGVTDDCVIEYQALFETEYWISSWIIQKDIMLLSGEYRWILGEFDISSATAEYYGGMSELEALLTPNYLWLNQTGRPQVDKLPNIKETEELRFTTINVPPGEDEPYSLPDDAVRERLIKYYGSNASPAGFWGKQTQNESERCREFCKKEKRLKKVADRFRDIESDEEKIRTVYRWCQDSIINISYVDLYDEDDPDKKIEPKERDHIDDVLKYRYGTRREIDILFWALLQELNVEGMVGRFKDRSDDLFIYKAKYWQFDHTIVAIPSLMGKYRYLTPGHAFTPANMCPWYAEGVDVLHSAGDVMFGTTPFARADVSAATLSHVYTIGDDLAVAGEVSGSLNGHTARTMRVLIHDEDPDHQATALEDELADLYPAAEMDSVLFENLHDIYQPFNVRYHLSFAPVTEAGGRVMLKPCSYLTDAENPFTADERHGGILFRHAHRDLETIQITIPEGWEIEGLPSDTAFANEVGECQLSFESFGQTISVQRLFELKLPYWPADKYYQVRRLFQFTQDVSDQIAVLRTN
ncbi:DUF3857 domain-containing protein [candidate division GN15 bacterium]|nr:DUF3857 domain-containing protein [candidate division GN15 bacterium]